MVCIYKRLGGIISYDREEVYNTTSQRYDTSIKRYRATCPQSGSLVASEDNWFGYLAVSKDTSKEV